MECNCNQPLPDFSKEPCKVIPNYFHLSNIDQGGYIIDLNSDKAYDSKMNEVGTYDSKRDGDGWIVTINLKENT